MKNKFGLRMFSFLFCILTAISVCTVASVSVMAVTNTVVTTDAVRLRSSAEIADDNYIATLGVSETLTLLKNSRNGWANVRRSDGTKGYCSVDYLDVPSDSAVVFKGKTTDEVNFRKGASTDYDSIAVLSNGQAFSVIDNSNEYWVNVVIEGKKGYIYRSYTSLSLSLGSEEVTEPTEPANPSEPDKPTEPVTEATYPVTEPTQPTEIVVPDVDPIATPNWYSSTLLEGNDVSSRVNLTSDFCLSTKNISINTGESFKLSTLILGTSIDSVVDYESSDASVAIVAENGMVTGLSEGETQITASFRGKAAVCTVSVTGKAYEPVIPTEPSSTSPIEPEPSSTSSVEPEPSSTTPTIPIQTTVPTTALEKVEISDSKATIEKGNHFVLTSSKENTQWSSSNESVATVKDGIVTACKEGKAVITATAEGESATCSITVTAISSVVDIEYSTVEVSKGKTFYNAADSSSDITWTSSDESIAAVSNGFITGVKEGTAVITASASKGAKTCLVTVAKAEPVRFTYAYPNTVAKNEDVNLVAITDKTRTAVQFKVDINGTVKTVDATSKKTDGNTIVWTGTTAISEAGTYKVTAFSKVGNKYTSCIDSKTTVFVRENKDLLKETQEDRRVSDELIALLASFEGYVGNVYFDNLAGGIPTLGYGKVVNTGDVFYNDMTKTEAYAQLYDTVNNGGYSSNVNSYLKSLDANYNQQQFDSLVSFAYNIGYYGLKSDTEIPALIREAKEKKTDEKPADNVAYINGTEVNFRSGAGIEFSSLGWLSYPDTLTLLDKKLVNNDWYYVKTADGRKGYVYKDYVTLGVPTVEGEIYLSLIDKDEYTRVILEYHHAGSTCIYGLLHRRVDELDLFYYGDYERDGDENRFGYTFACNVYDKIKL